MATYIIPDVHGCLKTLKFLLEKKIKISTTDRIIMLGDYIDRGPDSAGTVEYIIHLIDSGYNIKCIKGNHEQLLLESTRTRRSYDLWMSNDGESTLRSYKQMVGLEYSEDSYPRIPDRHMEFFKSLPNYLIVDDKFIMVHGGLDFRLDDPFSDETSMLWKRPEPMPDSFVPGKKIFHGHTPVSIEYIKVQLNTLDVRLIGLDAGCVYKGKREGFGYLTALNLEKWELIWVENMEEN